MASVSGPPEVSVTLVELKDLSKTEFIRWKDVKLSIDILLLTQEDVEFTSCISFLDPVIFKSYHKDLGYVYFGDIGKDESTKLRVALFISEKCPQKFAVSVIKACEILRPTAIISVGCCSGLKERKVKLGDVVVSEELIRYAAVGTMEPGFEEMGDRVQLNGQLVDLIYTTTGKDWEPPLKNLKELEVKIHLHGVLLTGPVETASTKWREALLKRFPNGIATEMTGEGKSLTVVILKG